MCEVFGEFSRFIPQKGLAKLERGRDREGLVPDFKVLGGTLWKMDKLAELKVITCGLYHYPEGVSSRAVERRAGSLQREYERKAAKADREYGGFSRERQQAGEKGPVESRLAEFGELEGLVFGGFGEGNARVHELVGLLADRRPEEELHMARPRGYTLTSLMSEAGYRAKAVRILRQRLGVTAVRAQARLLLAKVQAVQEGPPVRSGQRSRQRKALQEARWDAQVAVEASASSRMASLQGRFAFQV